MYPKTSVDTSGGPKMKSTWSPTIVPTATRIETASAQTSTSTYPAHMPTRSQASPLGVRSIWRPESGPRSQSG